jgi:hypothetical protein
VPAFGDGAALRLLFQQDLRFFTIVPEIGRGGDLVDGRDALQRAVDVKDAPGANPACSRGPRSDPWWAWYPSWRSAISYQFYGRKQTTS